MILSAEISDIDRCKNMKKISLLAILLAVVLLICSCGNCSCAKKSKFRYENDMIVDEKTGIKYECAPFAYQPVSFGAKYATQEKSGIVTEYYQLGDMPTDKWLTNEDLCVFYAQGVELPSFEELNSNRILICEKGEQTVSLFDITDKEKVQSVIDEYLGARRIKGNPARSDVQYLLNFRGDSYPFLQYSLEYLEYEGGLVIYDKTDDISSYKYQYSESEAKISHEQNEDGSFTVSYDLGKYFIYSRYEGFYCQISDALALEMTEE